MRWVTPIESAIGGIYLFCKEHGLGSEARGLVDEFWHVDRECLLAELRLLVLNAGFTPAVVAAFDR